MKKILITGGAGFIGSHVVEFFYKKFKNSKIIIVDKLTYSGKKKFLKNIIKSKRIKFIKSDIVDIKNYEKELKKYIKFIKDRPFNDKRYFLNLNKISSIGWKPKHNFFKDLPGIIEWYKKNYKIFDEKNI